MQRNKHKTIFRCHVSLRRAAADVSAESIGSWILTAQLDSLADWLPITFAELSVLRDLQLFGSQKQSGSTSASFLLGGCLYGAVRL